MDRVKAKAVVRKEREVAGAKRLKIEAAAKKERLKAEAVAKKERDATEEKRLNAEAK